jgi:hypothetical protein
MLIAKMKFGVVIGVIHGWAWDKVTHKLPKHID